MSNYFHNVLSASGPHYGLEHFVTRNIQIRRDVNHSLAGKVPLFALNAMVPQPADAPLDWADEHWGCRFDTDSNKTVIGSVLGGTVAVIMPAYPIDANVPVKCHYIDSTMEFVEREFTVESMDCTDVNTDAEGNIGGILRLQIKLSP